MKIRCEYCNQRNDSERDECAFCGADLPDMPENGIAVFGRGFYPYELSTAAVPNYNIYFGITDNTSTYTVSNNNMS